MGWIAIDRCLLDSAIWNTGEPFTKGQAWIDLLLSANFEDTEQYVGYDLVKVQRGAYMTTIRDLSSRWKWSRSKVANFLHFLEIQKMVSVKSDTKKTLITIVKYKDFQDVKDTKKTRKGHESDTRKTREGNLLYKETREQINNITIDKVYFENPDVNKSFCEFIEWRDKGKHPINGDKTTITKLINKLNKLSGGDPQIMLEIIDQSIENDWRGFFELKQKKAAGSNQTSGGYFNAASYVASTIFEGEGLNEIRGD